MAALRPSGIADTHHVDAYDRYAQEHGTLERPRDAEATERQAVEEIQAWLRHATDLRFFEGFEIVEIRARGEFPRTEIQALFRWSRYEGMLFGHRRWIWEPDGSYAEFEVKDLLTFLVLDQRSRRQDLPPPAPDDEGVRWV